MKNTIKVHDYYNLTTDKWVPLVYSLKVGDIFLARTTKPFVEESIYLVMKRHLSLYDDNLDEEWDTPVPVYEIHNLNCGTDYTGIIPATDATYYELLA